jgi:hypothetical protein
MLTESDKQALNLYAAKSSMLTESDKQALDIREYRVGFRQQVLSLLGFTSTKVQILTRVCIGYVA